MPSVSHTIAVNQIDPKSRMVHAVAQVKDPYGLLADGEGGGSQLATAPLAVGLFVEAQILGRRLDDVVVLPRIALRDGDRVWIVDGEDRLHAREVEIVRFERDQVVIGAGLARGERVSVSPLQAVVEGMQVRVVADESPVAARQTARKATP